MSTAVVTQSTQLTVAQRAVAALGFDEKKEAELRELAERTKTITAITNKDGYTQVHNGRMALKNQRIEIQNAGKAAREDATAYSKAVIAVEKRAIGIISPEEDRLEALQGAYDAAIEAEKEAQIQAELARMAAIDARIEIIRNWPAQYSGKPSSLVEQQVRVANDYVIDDFFEEKAQIAQAALETARLALAGILAERKAHEAEQERIKAERAELEALRAAQAKRDAEERARIAEEERSAKAARDAEATRQAAELKAQRQKQDAEAAAERKRIADEEAAAKAIRDAEAKKLAAERAEFERQQAEARRIKEEEERVKREQARLASIQKPSDDELLGVLAKHYSVPVEKAAEWILAIDFSQVKAA